MICIENKDFVLDEHTVVTLGKFDGIHKGHRKLIHKALEISRKTGMKSAVFTPLKSVFPKPRRGMLAPAPAQERKGS